MRQSSLTRAQRNRVAAVRRPPASMGYANRDRQPKCGSFAQQPAQRIDQDHDFAMKGNAIRTCDLPIRTGLGESHPLVMPGRRRIAGTSRLSQWVGPITPCQPWSSVSWFGVVGSAFHGCLFRANINPEPASVRFEGIKQAKSQTIRHARCRSTGCPPCGSPTMRRYVLSQSEGRRRGTAFWSVVIDGENNRTKISRPPLALAGVVD